MTFKDLWGQNNISYNTLEYPVIMYATNCSAGYFFFSWPLFDLCFDLQWPLIPSEVKIAYHIILGDVIWVWMQTIAALGAFFKFDLFLTFFWPSVTSTVLWDQNNLAYVSKGNHMSTYPENCIPGGIFKKLPIFWHLLTSSDL